MAPRAARIAPQARAWFLKEVAYLAKRNPAAAEKLVAQMKEVRRRLAEHPRLGSTGAIPGTRRFVVRSYILTYRYRDGASEITAIRHARQADAHEPQEAFEVDAPPDENDGDPGVPRYSR